MWGTIKNIIRKAVTTTVQKDGNVNYNIQVKSYGAPLKAEVIYPYGTAGSAPISSSALLFHIGDQPENVVVIPYRPQTRFKGLKEGEYVAGNQEKQTFIKFLENGDIEIKTNANCKITGNVEISEDLTVEGELTALNASDPISLSDFRSVYNSHTHSDPQGGNTGPPNQPI